MLNQTNIEENRNKYYQILLLKDSTVYSAWTRQGRVGHDGQIDLIHSGGDLEEAKKVFKDKFSEETGNEWENRRNFEKLDGKYDMMIDVKIQTLLKLIWNPKIMKSDMKKIPLGKLTSEQIDAGYEALESIEEYLNSNDPRNGELVEASNIFYTRIPHNSGTIKPPIIVTEDKLKEKIALLEALRNEHPLERYYCSLQCELQPLDSSSREYQMIEDYLQTTQGKYTMTIVDIFSVDRKGESDNFRSDLNNRTLLWHGSRLSNWVSILSEGLKVAQPKATLTGSNFGEGIYFSDMSSKSAYYWDPSQTNPDGLLLLCEVALGDCNKVLDADPEARNLPPGKHSTKRLGWIIPDPDNSETLRNVIIPMGPKVTKEERRTKDYSLLYNQYVVYNPAQVHTWYLLRIRFNYS